MPLRFLSFQHRQLFNKYKKSLRKVYFIYIINKKDEHSVFILHFNTVT